MLLFFKVSRQNNPATTRKSISTSISLMTKEEVIWFIYNLVPPSLCWKPLMTRCLPSAGLRVFCHNAMMDYRLGDLLWLSARQRLQNERVEKRQGNTPICHACHFGSRRKVHEGKAEWDSPLLPPSRCPPHSAPTSAHPSRKAQPTLETGVVLVAVDSILHFESLTEGVTI